MNRSARPVAGFDYDELERQLRGQRLAALLVGIASAATSLAALFMAVPA